MMTIEQTPINDVFIITPKVFGDNRGWFKETYNRDDFIKHGLDYNFIQDNHSFSERKGVIRGLHYQESPYAQTKLIRCVNGAITDVIVDLRKDSATYLNHIMVELSRDNHRMLLIPKGFAHGFVTMTDMVEIEYKVDMPYAPEYDRAIRYDDPTFNINWNVKAPILSDKDLNAPFYKDI